MGSHLVTGGRAGVVAAPRHRGSDLRRAHARQALFGASCRADRRQRPHRLGPVAALFPVVARRVRQFRHGLVAHVRHEVAPPLGRYGRRHVCGATRPAKQCAFPGSVLLPIGPTTPRTFAHIDRIDARRAALISRALGAACMHTGTFAAYDFAQRVEAVVGGRLPEEDDLHYLSAVLYAYRHAA